MKAHTHRMTILLSRYPCRHLPDHPRCFLVERRILRTDHLHIRYRTVTLDDETDDDRTFHTILYSHNGIFHMLGKPSGKLRIPTGE